MHTDTIEVTIHTGLLSADNGATGPLSVYFALAELLGVEASVGLHYGLDKLYVPAADWPIAEELLVDSKMLCRLPDDSMPWRNAQSREVVVLLARR